MINHGLTKILRRIIGFRGRGADFGSCVGIGDTKINSGDIVAIAEVVRDLYRSESQPEQSYSERQLYEAALDRLSREIAVVQHSTETEAVKEIETQLAKSPRRGAKTEAGAEAEGDAEGDIDEADDADGDDAAVADEAA